jgi:hypothetical protein
MRFVTTGTTDGRSFAAVVAHRRAGMPARRDGKRQMQTVAADERSRDGTSRWRRRRATLALLFEDGPALELTPAMDERTRQNRLRLQIHNELINSSVENIHAAPRYHRDGRARDVCLALTPPPLAAAIPGRHF